MGRLLQLLRSAYAEPAPLPGQDPWVMPFDGGHLLVQSSHHDRRIVVRRVHDLDTLAVGRETVVWRTAPWWRCRWPRHDRQLWAPELHHLDGSWYLYLAASDGTDAQHRCYVLTADSPFGPFREVGWIGDVAADTWAIDLTVLEHAGRRYAVWSGHEHALDPAQHLYVAPMCDPGTISGPRVRIASPGLAWETSVAPINEGPQALRSPDGRTLLLFAADASWSGAYATGVLELVGDDPLDPAGWHKHPEPLLVGGGHGCVVQDRYVFHRKTSPEPGWADRVLASAPLTWDARGLPVVHGGPVQVSQLHEGTHQPYGRLGG